ncbi:MAG: hypothetical protein R3C20_16300 [Planctomycetaceae bacterium]
MPVFDYRFFVNAPVAEVAAFHFEPGILKTLTPPLMVMQIHSSEPIDEGSVARFTMWMGPIPVPWTAIHSNVSSAGFTDTQQSGPMKSWVHTHRFRAIADDVTEVHEHIEYEHFRGFRGLWSRLLFNAAGLKLLFMIRRQITRSQIRMRLNTPGSTDPSNGD